MVSGWRKEGKERENDAEAGLLQRKSDLEPLMFYEREERSRNLFSIKSQTIRNAILKTYILFHLHDII